MAKVRILSDRVANQIAAGEVIERPAAVVKELVENALDAGATRVVVEFAHAGKALIRVEDNGSGMSPEDARTALKRHATSKIAEAGDLDRLSTFGFRGEALPSIASVSRFALRTRDAAGDAGVEILVNAGRSIHEKAFGMARGTRIDVEHLFEPVPARRKFLKSDRTESAHIVNCVRLYALACPATSFALFEDGREIFHSPECPGLADRVAEIFGRQATEGLVPIDVGEPGLRITGLIGKAGVSRATRHDMVAFINARPVESRTINGALMEGYRESVPQGRYPVAFIFIECDPAQVDVNVHPAKREVRFRSEALVRGFIIRAVLGRLREGADRVPAQPPMVLGAPEALPAPFHSWTPTHSSALVQVDRAEEPPAAPAAGATGGGEGANSWRFLGGAFSSYLVFEAPNGVVLLDRRAAHERIWYERLKAQFESEGVPVQRLLISITLELSPVLSAILVDHRDFLSRHGLEIVEFGRHFFRIEALPSWLEPGDAEAFVRDLLGAVREGRIPASNVELAREELARLASSKAIRLPPVTGDAVAQSVLRDLFATSTPGSSPAGRPTYVELNHSELARRFQK
jgi:DNA mismatch repair protein MutL